MLVLSDSLLTLVLQDCDRVSTVANVLCAQVQGLGHPAVDAAKDNGVLIDLLLLDALDRPFQKAELLVFLEH